jgi:hypothetical protein
MITVGLAAKSSYQDRDYIGNKRAEDETIAIAEWEANRIKTAGDISTKTQSSKGSKVGIKSSGNSSTPKRERRRRRLDFGLFGSMKTSMMTSMKNTADSVKSSTEKYKKFKKEQEKKPKEVKKASEKSPQKETKGTQPKAGTKPSESDSHWHGGFFDTEETKEGRRETKPFWWKPELDAAISKGGKKIPCDQQDFYCLYAHEMLHNSLVRLGHTPGSSPGSHHSLAELGDAGSLELRKQLFKLYGFLQQLLADASIQWREYKPDNAPDLHGLNEGWFHDLKQYTKEQVGLPPIKNPYSKIRDPTFLEGRMRAIKALMGQLTELQLRLVRGWQSRIGTFQSLLFRAIRILKSSQLLESDLLLLNHNKGTTGDTVYAQLAASLGSNSRSTHNNNGGTSGGDTDASGRVLQNLNTNYLPGNQHSARPLRLHEQQLLILKRALVKKLLSYPTNTNSDPFRPFLLSPWFSSELRSPSAKPRPGDYTTRFEDVAGVYEGVGRLLPAVNRQTNLLTENLKLI